MTLTEDDVRYVAQLANLNLAPEEIPQLVRKLGDILSHMGRPAGRRRAPAANAPLSAPGYFKVPLVIER